MGRAFGIAATSDQNAAARIAAEAEQLGYSTLWVNDTPMADGLTTAEQVATSTTTLRIGLGVVAVDRRPVEQWLVRLSDLPIERVTVGVGAGLSGRPTQVVREAVAELREAIPNLRLAVAAMGPRMIRTAGDIADLVLLNWMTPARIDWARKRLGESVAIVAAYVRVAHGPEARELIAAEATRYSALPHYRRHFKAMGAEGGDAGVVPGVVLGRDGLDPYESRLDETVVRGVTADPSDTEATLDLIRRAAPADR